jgi:radical SAM-linked protein
MSKCDLEIIFRKRGLSRFLSHLDLMRSFEQACRRADLPVRFTQGFHPKVKLSSPRALALGTESECEVLVIGFEEDVDPVHVRERLGGHLPGGRRGRRGASAPQLGG